jgi:hypothetical protein
MKGNFMRIFLALLFILPACSIFQKSGCFVQDQATVIATQAVSTALECSNHEAVQKDLSAVIEKAGLCNQPLATGPISDAFCPLISASVVKFVADNSIPAAWGCLAANAKDKVSSALASACKMLPVSAGK